MAVEERPGLGASHRRHKARLSAVAKLLGRVVIGVGLLVLCVAGWMMFPGYQSTDNGGFFELRPLGIVLAVLVFMWTPVAWMLCRFVAVWAEA